MQIPGADRAVISEEKIVEYLLNLDHPDGASKARVLARAGFDLAWPQELSQALREQHLACDARGGRESPFGKKYKITAPLTGPAGTVAVTSVWMVRKGESSPRLITLVPGAMQ